MKIRGKLALLGKKIFDAVLFKAEEMCYSRGTSVFSAHSISKVEKIEGLVSWALQRMHLDMESQNH